MTVTLPKLTADTKLARLFDDYITGLAPLADCVAPRMSMRVWNFTKDTDAHMSTSWLFYFAHTVSAALAVLHENYAKAEAALADGLAANATPEELHLAAAAYFATPQSTDELIGAADAEGWPTPKDLADFAKSRARAAGLMKFGSPGPKVVKEDVDKRLRRALRDGEHAAAAFLAAETVKDFEGVLSRLRRIMTQRRFPTLL